MTPGYFSKMKLHMSSAPPKKTGIYLLKIVYLFLHV